MGIPIVATGVLGFIFTILGLNMLVFLVGITASPPIKLPPLDGDAGAFMALLVKSKFQVFEKTLEVIGGILLLLSLGLHRYAPVAIIILGPIVLCILFFHLLFLPLDKKLIIPFILVICLLVLIKTHWHHFQGLFLRHF